jgi:hypothetical protein
VRLRLPLILFALTVLTFAGLDRGAPRTAEPGDWTPTQNQISTQPAPDSALPAIISAVAKRSATVQTLPALAGRHDLARPVDVTGTAHRGTQRRPEFNARPLTFPLLI